MKDALSHTHEHRCEKFAYIEQINITATLKDGDTGPGDGDENHLTLALDGIDSGIKLNGYRDHETNTHTRRRPTRPRSWRRSKRTAKGKQKS